jgi:tetratricopeptide (TPR) repeat protein
MSFALRRWLRTCGFFVILTSFAFASTSAFADSPPSVWERAKDKDVGEAHDVHRIVERRLAALSIVARVRGSEGELLGVKAILENALKTNKHIILRLDLAKVHSALKEHKKAQEIYKEVLAEQPNHASAEETWIRLAFACGHTGDHECERKAYIEVLRRMTEEVFRGIPTLNLAETEMHLGNLRDAIDGYREALRIAGRGPSRDSAPLAVWGLAVALDRSGDHLGAEKEARFAFELEGNRPHPPPSMGLSALLHNFPQSPLREDSVFFVPDYEIRYYDGLGAIALARSAGTAHDALRLWRLAESYFTGYVRGAEAAKEKDRWLEHAKARLAYAKAEREKAEKRAAREAPPAPQLDVSF